MELEGRTLSWCRLAEEPPEDAHLLGWRLGAGDPGVGVEREGEPPDDLGREARVGGHPHPFGGSPVAHVGGVAEELEGVEERVESGILGRDRVDEEEAASGAQDPRSFCQGTRWVGVVVGAQPARDQVEAPRFEGQGSDIGDLDRDVLEPPLASEVAGHLNHLRGDVDGGHGLGPRGERQGCVARAAAHVEHPFGAGERGFRDQRGEVRAGGVDAAGGVGGGHRPELAADGLSGLLRGHGGSRGVGCW